MCCSDTQGWLGFPWPPSRGGGLKRALRSPGRYAAGRCRFVFSCLRGEAQSEGAGVKAGTQRSMGSGAPGLDAGASGDYLASPSKQEEPQRPEAGQGSGPRAAPTREASPAMGSLPRRPDPRAHSPTSDRCPPAGRSAHPPAWTRPSSGPPDRRKRLCARARRRSAAPASTEMPRYYCRTSVVPTQSASIRTGVNELMSRAVPHVDNHPLSTCSK